jgi:ribosome-binding factor A
VSYKKRWKGRAHDATADAVFERALLGGERADRRTFDARSDRKTQQLCQQVKRALAGGCDDPVLSDVYIDSVEPVGNGSHLLVRVTTAVVADLSPGEVMARLNDRSARLRAVVAQSICRKRVPGLSFVVVPQLPQSLSEEGRHD